MVSCGHALRSVRLAWHDNEQHAAHDLTHAVRINAADPRFEFRPVKCCYLRHIDHARLGQIGLARAKLDVTGCVSAPQVGRDSADYDGANTARVEYIILDD